MKKYCLLILSIWLFAINASFSQTTILNEEFTNNSRGWDVGKQNIENSQINMGKYVMHNYQKNRWHWFAIDVDLNEQKNFLIETNINKLESESNKETFGLMWGTKNPKNAYAFVINTSNQSYTAFSIFDGTWFKLINWQKSEFINYGNTANKLGIAKIDDELFFLINGEPVNSTSFQEFYGKKIGFYVGGKLKIMADNLVVKEGTNNATKAANSDNEWKGNGTGFFISNDGYIATNYHLIKGVSEIEIEFENNGKKLNYKAKVVQSDKQNDLAILKVDDKSFKSFTSIPYNFQTSLEDVGSEVFALGYPLALSVMGTEIKFTDGKISSKTGFQGDISTYQMTTPIQPGNSGGPLFDFDGNLIGINSAKIRSDIADNVSYAIKSSYLKNLIDVLPNSLSLPHDNSLKNKKLTENIKALSDYVVLIKVK